MTVNEYQKLALSTMNPKLNRNDVLINSAMGLCGEAGEVIDIVKKWFAHGHELNRQKLIEELGDVAWYIAEAAYALDTDLEKTLSRRLFEQEQHRKNRRLKGRKLHISACACYT